MVLELARLTRSMSSTWSRGGKRVSVSSFCFQSSFVPTITTAASDFAADLQLLGVGLFP